MTDRSTDWLVGVSRPIHSSNKLGAKEEEYERRWREKKRWGGGCTEKTRETKKTRGEGTDRQTDRDSETETRKQRQRERETEIERHGERLGQRD